MDYREHLTITPGVRSGRVCVKGTRTTVKDIFEYLGGGMTVAEVLDDFPSLTAEDIQACFAYAAEWDRRMMTVSSAAEILPSVPHEAAV